MNLEEEGAAPGRCAAHPDRPAARCCERCGNYMCEACDGEGAQRACPSCRARVDLSRFPIERETFSIGGVMQVTTEAFGAHWIPLCAGAFVYLVVTLGFGAFGQVIERAALDPASRGLTLLALNLVQMALGWLLLLGLLRMSYDALEGRTVDLAHLFGEGGKVWKLFVVTLLISLAMGVPLALMMGGAAVVGAAVSEGAAAVAVLAVVGVLLVPLLYVSLGLTFVAHELVYDDTCGPLEAIRRSWKLVEGHRLPLLGLGLLFGLVVLLGALACCVGLVPAYAYFFLGLTAAHRGLRNGMDLPDPTRPLAF